MTIEVTNYTVFPAARAAVRAVAQRAQKVFRFPSRTQANVFFVNDSHMRDLNRRTRRVNRPTDVLAFPLHDVRRPGSGLWRRRDADGVLRLGDVVVSVPAARRQAREHEVSFRAELMQLVAHGLLHLLGYDHVTAAEERTMTQLTRQLAGVP